MIARFVTQTSPTSRWSRTGRLDLRRFTSTHDKWRQDRRPRGLLHQTKSKKCPRTCWTWEVTQSHKRKRFIRLFSFFFLLRVVGPGPLGASPLPHVPILLSCPRPELKVEGRFGEGSTRRNLCDEVERHGVKGSDLLLLLL